MITTLLYLISHRLFRSSESFRDTKLVHFFCRESYLCDIHALVFREAVVLDINCTDAYHVTDLVPEIIGVEGIGILGGLVIFKLAAASRKFEAV